MLASIQPQIETLLDQAGGSWGIVIEDLLTNQRFERNPDEPFFAASLIKVPIMASVFADVYAGKYTFEDQYILRQEDLVGGSGVLQHLSPGLSLSIYDLVTLMIIQSDNTATNILIDQTGVESIRQIMRKTGMAHSQFYNRLMIIPAELEGLNEVTAGDMASLYKLMANGKILSYNSCLQMISILKKQQIRDTIPYHLPDPDSDPIGTLPRWELANKTGNVTNINHDTGILYVRDSAILLSFLSKNVEEKLAKDTIGRIVRLIYDTYRE
ncbi:serine hydrolase [Brevibacillus sp. SYSU BS000544]|uniref:serine hydrolase n=1 Tax=Brevibacillus sp. SYSU BS000544 TaxID=3416443 RepID=UPI003CE448CB